MPRVIYEFAAKPHHRLGIAGFGGGSQPLG
jgi:hypothetical protein